MQTIVEPIIEHVSTFIFCLCEHKVSGETVRLHRLLDVVMLQNCCSMTTWVLWLFVLLTGAVFK